MSTPGTSGSDAGLSTWLVCAGCGYRAPDMDSAPLRCPLAHAGDDIDHVMTRYLDPRSITFPHGSEPNPFIRYRALFHAYHWARAKGWSDAEYVALVERLDEAVVAVDGRGFRSTPMVRSHRLGDQLGFTATAGVMVKDETAGVSGSHKARHLMGTLIELEVARALRLQPNDPAEIRPRLAIASCGNAAIAAAVLARAAGRDLEVFIPSDAEPTAVARLLRLGATTTLCERETARPGDPTYWRLVEAVDAGAVPFTCQGNLNGLAIEGGATLGYEMVSELASAAVGVDHLIIQVGGGALASACAQAFSDARRLGELMDVPRIHTVQTRGASPLARAYGLVTDRLLAIRPLGVRPVSAVFRSVPPHAAAERARLVRAVAVSPQGRAELAEAARHRSAFMWPWETEPRSIATGIIDDETYDWLAVVGAMLETGGTPIVVDEASLGAACELAIAATGIDVDATGSAGLAGLLELRRRGVVRPTETVAVIFTGIRRRPDTEARHDLRSETGPAIPHRERRPSRSLGAASSARALHSATEADRDGDPQRGSDPRTGRELVGEHQRHRGDVPVASPPRR